MPYYPAVVDPQARNTINPADRALLAENFPLHLLTSFTILPTAGLLQMARIKMSAPGTITNLCIYISVAGGTLTSGQNFAVLYSTAGVKLGATATMHTAWTGTGLITMPLTAAYAAAAGSYYVGFYYNGTTAPTIARGPVTAAINAGSLTPNFLWQTADTGLTTTIPDPYGAVTALTNSWWVGIS